MILRISYADGSKSFHTNFDLILLKGQPPMVVSNDFRSDGIDKEITRIDLWHGQDDTALVWVKPNA